jgi:alpha-beta hydrolase superfamily lysophospholipase
VDTRRAQERGFFSGPDGLSFYYEQDTLPDARGAVLLLHGYAEHCGRYTGLVDDLVAAGLSVWRFDYRGHGRSGGRRGHVYRFEDYFDEIRMMRDRVFAATAGSGLPRFLVGHSHGGLLALSFAAREAEGFRGLALSSPFFGFGSKVPSWKAAAGRALSRVLPTLALPTEIDPATLTHDASVVKAYASDTLVGTHATARWFTEVLRVHAEAPDRAAALSLPVLVQQGADDRVASPAATRAVYARIASADKTLHEYPGLLHEIYFETERRVPVGDLVRWLEAHL